MTAPVLYLHVADDGGLLTIDADSGRSEWVTAEVLDRRLGQLVTVGGRLLVSREQGSPLAEAVLRRIATAGLPVTAAAQAHPDAVRPEGLTATMSAAYLGAVELLADLLDRGADPDTGDDQGYTALMYAANAGEVETVRLLLAAGARTEVRDHQGSTALMFAAQHGHLAVVKRLLVAGADPAARRPDGLTAHDLATANGRDRVAAILISAGGSGR